MEKRLSTPTARPEELPVGGRLEGSPRRGDGVARPAFTFAEVLLALLVLTGSMYVYSGLQYRSIAKVRRSTGQVDRVFFIKKFLYQLYAKPPTKNKPLKVTITNPDIIITAHKQEIDTKKSSLKSFAKEIDIIWSQGTWNEGIDKRSMKMISFVKKVDKDEKK